MQFPYLYEVEFTKPLQPTPLQMMLVQGDSLANRIVVRLKRGGMPVVPSGACAGIALRADGGPVALPGGITEDGLLYVDLPQAAYAKEGQITISIQLAEDESLCTVFVGFGTVIRTGAGDTIIDPGTIIPSVSALITAIDDAVASIPADYSDLLGEVASVKQAFGIMRDAYTDRTPIDLTGQYTIFITAANLWSYSGSPLPKSVIKKIPDNAKYAYFKANPNEVAVIAFLTTNAHSTGTTPDYATGTGRITIPAGEEAEYQIPSDAEYVYIFLSRSETTYQPTTADFISYKEYAQQANLAKYVETSLTASRRYNVNEFLVLNSTLYRVIATINSGSQFVINTNVEAITIGEVLTALLNA